ncbi:MAG: sterol desaturase family protein, partial [Candidatus Eisenbacteria bacterium]|nr:sterol desaturase family protein [Candidatus Eisenbacteria bacterium]
EWKWPWRPDQKQLRPRLWSDLLHLVFNGHFLGVILYGLGTALILPGFDNFLKANNLYDVAHRDLAASWPIWVQILVALFVTDFVHWCVHNLLHRVPFLWHFHKTHHSVADGEMDWIVAFRFQWTEVAVYKAIQYLPLAYFGFGYEAVMFHAIFGTLIGHLNHSNLKLDYGPLRYLLNNPRMHIWHHNYDATGRTTVNFGIIFSCWDYIFRTAHVPAQPPRKIGFSDMEGFPTTFFAQTAWPLQQVVPAGAVRTLLGIVIGALLIVAGWMATA